jgi:hypothetical protein
MLDIETLGQGPGCVVISIAAVPFYRTDCKVGDAYFHMNVDIESCLALGLKIDPSTLHWWIQKAGLFQELQKDTYELKGTLLSLRSFIAHNCEKDVRVWGKGPSFDNAILRYAYDLVNQPLPWKYSRERCVRTDLDGYEDRLKNCLRFNGIEHNPVDDARHQIACMAKVRMIVNQMDSINLEID